MIWDCIGRENSYGLTKYSISRFQIQKANPFKADSFNMKNVSLTETHSFFHKEF